MSSNYYVGCGWLIRITPELLSQIGADSDLSYSDIDENSDEIFAKFEAKFGICPLEIIDFDFSDIGPESGVYFRFADEDCYQYTEPMLKMIKKLQKSKLPEPWLESWAIWS